LDACDNSIGASQVVKKTDWLTPGASIAWKEKLLPAVTLNGMLGRPMVAKFGFQSTKRQSPGEQY